MTDPRKRVGEGITNRHREVFWVAHASRRVGFGVSPKQAFLYASRSEEMIVTGRVAIARRNRQHARSVRYPDHDSRSDSRWLDTLSCGTDSCLPLVRSFNPTRGHSSPKTMAKLAPVCSASRNWRAIFALASE